MSILLACNFVQETGIEIKAYAYIHFFVCFCMSCLLNMFSWNHFVMYCLLFMIEKL